MIGLQREIDDQPAGLAAVALFLALGVLRVPRDWVRGRFTRRSSAYRIAVSSGGDAEAVRAAIVDLHDVEATLVGAEKQDGNVEFQVELQGAPGQDPAGALGPLVAMDDVRDVTLVEAADT